MVAHTEPIRELDDVIEGNALRTWRGAEHCFGMATARYVVDGLLLVAWKTLAEVSQPVEYTLSWHQKRCRKRVRAQFKQRRRIVDT